jgi:hypothetical protein
LALSNQIAAYEDCLDYFERAQNAPKGIRILKETFAQAYSLRQRLHHFRVLERAETTKLYAPTDPQYNKSENDKFRVTLQSPAEGETGTWVYIEPWAADHIDIEELE